ncbi:MAG: hypothetical protein LH632_01090 [Rhodoferax sp.]|nr:hypothetical protein [Rhodoferax sp.]
MRSRAPARRPAFGAYLVGLLTHHGSVQLGLLMLALTLCALAAQIMWYRA